MQNTAYRKLLHLKLFRNRFCLYFHYTIEKGFNVIEIVKKMSSEGDRDDFEKKIVETTF